VAEIQEQDANATALPMTSLGISLVQFDFHSKPEECQNKDFQLKLICPLYEEIFHVKR